VSAGRAPTPPERPGASVAEPTHIARTGGHPLLRVVAAISTVAGWISAAMIVAAVGITCQMIWVRFVLNHSTIWQTEAVVYLVIGATLIGLPYVQRLRGHVNVDIVPRALGPGGRRALALVVLGVTAAMVAVMLWYGVELWRFAWDRGWRSDSVWGPPLWIPYLAIPVGLGLFLLQVIADLAAVAMRIDTPFGID
jgi:TRAP-type C4-dicarboxylate transport system permease small subunit